MNRFASSAVGAAATCLLLAGCAMHPVEEPRFQTQIPEGSAIVLERSLEIAPGEQRVYMQDGRVLRPRTVQLGSRFRPRCWFRVTGSRDAGSPTRIEAGSFRTGEMRTRAHAYYGDTPDVKVASRSLAGLKLADAAGGGVGFLTHIVEIPLSSSEQPHVQRLACEVDRRTGVHRTLGVHAIQQASGEILRVEMAEASGR